MLHVANGDIAANLILSSGVAGDVLPWRDVLHEGPVPSGLALEEMAQVRAHFLASCGWGTYQSIYAELQERDRRLLGARAVTLWFEHDLYDQLQLLQILCALDQTRPDTLNLICVNQFSGVEPFHGLGQLTPEQLATLWTQRQPVSEAQLHLAKKAWAAFSSPCPADLRNLLSEDLSELPYLRPALQRHLQEYPSGSDGLSRTERQILEAVAEGYGTFEEVYAANQRKEASIYMGDAVVRMYIERLAHARTPLLTGEPLRLTEAGRRVLAGILDQRKLNGCDRWLGGVHVAY